VKRTPAELIEDAERFAVAQETKAAHSKEDSEHWHHVALAALLRDMAAEIKGRVAV
jgi:hypothetical protein